jgi:DNA polymerase/3'-5' exonuclease PolX
MARTTLTNKDAADLLFDVATILEKAEDNPYRVRAYRRAARLLLRRQDEIGKHLNAKGELDLPGLGPRLRRKLGELISKGRMTFYIELCADLPPAVSRLMSVPTVGPKTAWRLNEELGITNAAELKAAAESGKIRTLYGFGEKRERHLLDGAIAVLNGHPKIYAPLPPEDDELDADVVTNLPAPVRRPDQLEQLPLLAMAEAA